jgi:hypothetical protein
VPLVVHDPYFSYRQYRARPVVGAVFIKALSDAETWKKWARPAGREN